MPNAHAADKETISLYVPRTLAMRIRRAAKLRKETLTEYLNSVFTNATQHIELTPEDYQAIAEAVAKAQKGKGLRSTVNSRPSRVARKNAGRSK